MARHFFLSSLTAAGQHAVSGAIATFVHWPQIAHLWTQHCYFHCNRQAGLNAPAFLSLDQLKQHKELRLFYQQLIEKNLLATFYQDLTYCSAALPAGELCEQLKEHRYLDLQHINSLVNAWHSVDLYWDQLASRSQTGTYVAQGLQWRKEVAPRLTPLVRKVREFLNRQGTVDVDRHPKLGPLFRQLKREQDDFSLWKKSYLQNCEQLSALVRGDVELIDEHYAIYVRSDRYEQKWGPIISRSSSGQSLLIETEELSRWSASRRLLLQEIQEVERQLAQELCDLVFFVRTELIEVLEQIVHIDLWAAQAKCFAQLHWVMPQFDTEMLLEIEQGFYPLLEQPIGNHFALNRQRPICVISGPNGGGKSLLLKTVALLVVLARCGFAVPALGITLHPQLRLCIDADDNASFSSGLSAFGAQVKFIQDFLAAELSSKDVTPGLLIIDEIFNATSSLEASALGFAWIDYCYRHLPWALLTTTHHQELKVRCHQTDFVESAHMSFQEADLTPTYKLIMGRPGKSYALALWKKLGQRQVAPAFSEIEHLAKEQLETRALAYEDLLAQLNEEQQALKHRERELESKSKQQEQQYHAQMLHFNRTLEQQQDHFAQLKEKLKNQAADLLEEIRSGEVKKNKHIEQRLYQQTPWEASPAAELLLKPNVNAAPPVLQAKQHEHEADEIKIHSRPVPVRPADLQIGQRYQSQKFTTKVTLLSLDHQGREAQILLGQLKTKVPVADLIAPGAQEQTAVNGSKHQRVFVQWEAGEVALTLDGRGLRADVFERQLHQSLARLLSGDQPYVDVIHGHGDGVLKMVLKKVLEEYGIKKFQQQQAQNHTGMTRVSLSS